MTSHLMSNRRSCLSAIAGGMAALALPGVPAPNGEQPAVHHQRVIDFLRRNPG